MKDPVQLWHGEHMNFTRLLDLLDQEMSAFHDGGTPDYALMQDIVSYFREVPDRFHHPREDAAVACLLRHDPSLELRINRLMQEHRVIATAGSELAERLDQVLAGGVVARQWVESAAAIYLTYYRHHLATEERDVLPRAAALLTRADWQRVAAAVQPGSDPVFGPARSGPLHDRYRELRRRMGRDTATAGETSLV